MASEPPNQHIRYTSLSQDADHPEIRLVKLMPGTWDDAISCSLDVVSFDKGPTYEALSYVWGDPEKRKPIQLDDQSFEATANLWMALRRLRYPDAHRILWIDAICINQNDNDEKSRQVAMMDKIYSRCTKAVLWLGEEQGATKEGSTSTTTSKLACELLATLGRDKHFDELPCFSFNNGQRLEISSEYTDSFQALEHLLNAPWWTRIWVVQEMVLPKKVQFLYASEEFSYETLRSVVHVLDTHATTCCKPRRMELKGAAFDPLMVFQEQVEPMVSTRETWKNRAPTTLFELRRQFSAFHASEKRDLHYALLGLVTTWRSASPLIPDYGVPLESAVTKAVFKCISEQDGTEFLQGERRFRSSEDTMPSWVPDVNFTSIPSQWVLVEQRRLRMASCFSASASVRQETTQLELSKDGTLLLQSLEVDSIASIGTVFDALENFEQAPDVFREWMGMIGLEMTGWPEQPPQDGSQSDIFWRTMINDCSELDTNTSPFYRRADDNDYHNLRAMWDMLLKFQPLLGFAKLSFSDSSYESLLGKDSKAIYHILVCLWQRRMFLTERGLIGLAPAGASPGDEVHIILGCPVPFILRPHQIPSVGDEHPKSGRCYTVVGTGYMQEYMYGKAFEDKDKKDVKTIALH